MGLSGKCKLLKIYVREDETFQGRNMVKFLIKKLRELDMEGVTVTRALEGYGRDKALHTVKVLDLSTSLPIVIELVDTPEKIAQAVRAVKGIVGQGLMIAYDVDAV